MNIAKQFGSNLARARKRADLSQEDVSFLAGVHRTEVSNLERGLRVPRLDTVAKLAGAIGIDAGELFEGIVWEPGSMRRGHFELPDPGDTL